VCEAARILEMAAEIRCRFSEGVEAVILFLLFVTFNESHSLTPRSPSFPPRYFICHSNNDSNYDLRLSLTPIDSLKTFSSSTIIYIRLFDKEPVTEVDILTLAIRWASYEEYRRSDKVWIIEATKYSKLKGAVSSLSWITCYILCAKV
jgi:hypothetical protein